MLEKSSQVGPWSSSRPLCWTSRPPRSCFQQEFSPPWFARGLGLVWGVLSWECWEPHLRLPIFQPLRTCVKSALFKSPFYPIFFLFCSFLLSLPSSCGSRAAPSMGKFRCPQKIPHSQQVHPSRNNSRAWFGLFRVQSLFYPIWDSEPI